MKAVKTLDLSSNPNLSNTEIIGGIYLSGNAKAQYFDSGKYLKIYNGANDTGVAYKNSITEDTAGDYIIQAEVILVIN